MLVEILPEIPYPEATPLDISTEVLPLPPININLSILASQEKVVEVIPEVTDSRPIWEREGEYLFTKGTTSTYIIRKYKPGEEGVMKFGPFDQFDPVPSHYFPSRELYEKARLDHRMGGQPEQLIELHSQWKSNEVTVFDSNAMEQEEAA